MLHICILTIISALLSVSSSVWAQDGSDKREPSCVVAPIFHCVQQLEAGDTIGHFGYDLQCIGDVGSETEVYIDIGDNNSFSPDPVDRGQPKVFLPGVHIDEFEVEFSRAEVNAGSDIRWSVKGRSAVVDFSKTRDESLDCSSM